MYPSPFVPLPRERGKQLGAAAASQSRVLQNAAPEPHFISAARKSRDPYSPQGGESQVLCGSTARGGGPPPARDGAECKPLRVAYASTRAGVAILLAKATRNIPRRRHPDGHHRSVSNRRRHTCAHHPVAARVAGRIADR